MSRIVGPCRRGSGARLPRRALPLLVAASVGVVAVGACGSERSGSRAVVRDSAGVRIVENEAPDSARMTAWGVSSAPTLDIGKLEGSEDETLFRVVGALRLSDGRVAVANSGSAEVRYFGPDGRHLLSSGGEGGGPGEFQRITSLIPLPGDSLAVVDPFGRRLTVLGPDGAFAREIPVGDAGSFLTVVGRRPDGRWIARQNVVLGGNQIRQGLIRQNMAYVALDAAGAPTDTVGEFIGAERYIDVGSSGGAITSINVTTPPFSRTTTVVAAGDELFVATQDAAQIEVYGPDGALRRIVRTGVALRPVTSDLVDAFLDHAFVDLPDEQRKSARQAAAAAPIGKYVPPYGAIAVDRDGDLWVQDYAAVSDENRWTVYGPDGAARARIALPRRFTPYDIGDDWILGLEVDDLGVEHVRLYELGKGGSAG